MEIQVVFIYYILNLSGFIKCVDLTFPHPHYRTSNSIKNVTLKCEISAVSLLIAVESS